MKIICSNCGKEKEKPNGEVNRQIKKGRTNFFCSAGCAGIHIGARKKKPPVERVCKFCCKNFTITYRRQTAQFCSRGCASAGSITDYRRNKAKEIGNSNLRYDAEHASNMHKKSESWKYTEIMTYLDDKNIEYEFEYVIPGTKFIFDLCIPKEKILFEFDGSYHKKSRQIPIDKKKNEVAKIHGWDLIRVKTGDNEVLSTNLVEKYI